MLAPLNVYHSVLKPAGIDRFHFKYEVTCVEENCALHLVIERTLGECISSKLADEIVGVSDFNYDNTMRRKLCRSNCPLGFSNIGVWASDLVPGTESGYAKYLGAQPVFGDEKCGDKRLTVYHMFTGLDFAHRYHLFFTAKYTYTLGQESPSIYKGRRIDIT